MCPIDTPPAHFHHKFNVKREFIRKMKLNMLAIVTFNVEIFCLSEGLCSRLYIRLDWNDLL